ncbi:hypothetical protein Pst134EA_002759 [Puccinia striiformis f. sp. tritici]|uniref:hypothetical protein n=1 Tax=Puccinia striiformis f. sp. tritici TaxID=168172 RepID=UPI0020083B54|nr:hypothetical protein Pst134EA_002759 [Puccinia striiformis f. sp. tritici]KAH9472134.1 hypothetical protein Pst134EA_002759 [Puccinia striiformis f. sp. tritici]
MDRIRSLKKPRPTKQSLKPAEGHLIVPASEHEAIADKPVEEDEAEQGIAHLVQVCGLTAFKSM